MNETRKCRLCDQMKPLEMFEIDKRIKGGRTTRCKACKAGLNDKARTLYASLKHRAKQDEQPVEVTLKQLQALFAAFDGKCIYCGISEEEAGCSHHIDHVIPTSEGGRHHISNLVLACASCNASKGNKPFVEFYLRKKSEIEDDNFNALVYYIALTSGQPADEVLTSFVFQYVAKQYEHLSDLIGEELRDEVEKHVKLKFAESKAS